MDGCNEVFAFSATIITVAATSGWGSTSCNGTLPCHKGKTVVVVVGLVDVRIVIVIGVAVRLGFRLTLRSLRSTCLMIQNDYTF